jgi:hypothetical protein
MRKFLLATTGLFAVGAAHAQSVQSGTIGGMPYFMLPASGGCTAQMPCSVVTYLSVQSESQGATQNDLTNYFGGAFAQANPHTIVIAPVENGPQDATTNWGGYNTPTTPEGQQMVAVVQGVEASMGNTVNPADSVVTGGSLGGTGTQAALIAYGPKGTTTPGVFSAGVSFDAADWSAASDPAQIAALCGVRLTAVHGTEDTNQNISFDQNLQSAINSNPACGNSFTLVPIQDAGHGTWSGPSGYGAGTGPGTPLATIAGDLNSAPSTAAAEPAQAAITTSPTVAVPPATIPTAIPAATTPAQNNQAAATSETKLAQQEIALAKTLSAEATPNELLIGALLDDATTQLNSSLQDMSATPAAASAAPTGTTAATAPAAPAQPHAATTPTPAAIMPPAPVCGGGPASGGFHIVNGQIIGPDGNPFIARGVNVYDNEMGDADAIVATFTGVNFLRVNIHSYQDPSAYQSFITQMTSQGRVVELEDHPDGGGGQDAPFQGAQLAAESAWYASVAKAYANNPYVWFGTFNEPGQGSAGQLSAWHRATYQAIRGAGNNNPILIEPGGSRPDNLVDALVPSVYLPMTNVIMDPHIYGYQVNYSTDQATNDANAQAMVAAAQTIKTADGTIGVMIAEYGNSTDGTTIDQNGVQNVTAVVNMGAAGKVGSAAWAWNPGGNEDKLMNSSLTEPTSPYGQQVQLYINTTVQSCSATQTTANAQAATTAITAAMAQDPATPAVAAPTAASAVQAAQNATLAQQEQAIAQGTQ